MNRDKKATIVARAAGGGTHGTKSVDQTHATPDFAADTDRVSLMIQNVGTTAFSVATSATSPEDGIVLKGGTAAADGLGASIIIDEYTGAVYQHDLDGGGGTANYFEITGR